MGALNHSLGRVEANGVGEVRCKSSGSWAWTATNIEEGVELAASGSMMVDDDFVEVGVVAAAILGIVCALFLGIGAEGLLGRDGDKIWSRLRHGDGSVITGNRAFLCDVVWRLCFEGCVLAVRSLARTSEA